MSGADPVFEVTVVKTASMSLKLSEAQELLNELSQPSKLSDYDNDPKTLVEVAVSFAEGNTLEPEFDREIFVHLDSGSHVGTKGGS